MQPLQEQHPAVTTPSPTIKKKPIQGNISTGVLGTINWLFLFLSSTNLSFYECQKYTSQRLFQIISCAILVLDSFKSHQNTDIEEVAKMRRMMIRRKEV
jgi:hypothetical protein